MIKMMEQEKSPSTKSKLNNHNHNPNIGRDSDFERPLDKDKLNGVFKKPIVEGSEHYELGDMMAINRG